MKPSKLTLQRLHKEQAALEKESIPNALVARQDVLKFYFVLYGLQNSYAEGYYFGLLQLHENYPFSAPKLIFYTPSGRFETNIPICTSFTNYHQESWTSAWNVRTLVLATISFMYSEEPSYGCCHFSHEERVRMARQSLAFNVQSQTFLRLFGEKMKSLNLLDAEKIKIMHHCKKADENPAREQDQEVVREREQEPPLVPQVIYDEIPEELGERRERREKKPSFNWLRPTIWFALTIVAARAIFNHYHKKN